MSSVELDTTFEKIPNLVSLGNSARIPEGSWQITLGWPATAWRVLIPAPSPNHSDPLQRAILRLSRAGSHATSELSNWLDITPDLAQSMQYSFYLKGLLKEDGRITPEGERLLDNEDVLTFSDTSHEQAWMFRDSLSGDVIPVLHTEEALKFDHQIKGNCLADDLQNHRKPSVPQIRDALHRYRQYFNALHPIQRMDEEIDPNKDKTKEIVPGVAVVIWEKPELVRIPVHLFVLPDNPKDWNVSTNFSEPGLDHWFRDKLQWVKDRNTALQEIVSTLLKEASSIFPGKPTLPEMEARALENHPVLSNPELDDTFHCVAIAYRAELLFEQNPEYVDLVLMRYQKALEAILAACISSLPDRERNSVRDRITNDNFKSRLNDIVDEFHIEIPHTYRRLGQVSQLSYIQKNGGPSLTTLALFLLFYASEHRGSPAESCFRKQPYLLDRIAEVARHRNPQVHYTPQTLIGDKDQLVKEIAHHAATTINVFGEAFFGQK